MEHTALFFEWNRKLYPNKHRERYTYDFTFIHGHIKCDSENKTEVYNKSECCEHVVR